MSRTKKFNTLIQQWYGGHTQSYDKIWTEAYLYCGYYSLKYVGNVRTEDLEDLVCVSTSKAMKKVQDKSFNIPGSFPNYVVRIFDNTLMDYFRKQKGKKPVAVEEAYTLGEEDTPFEIRNLKYEQLLDAISRIPEEQQKVFHACVFENMKHREFAEQEGISVNTSIGRYRYALINIKRQLSLRYDMN